MSLPPLPKPRPASAVANVEHVVPSGRVTPPERFDPTESWAFTDLDSPAAADGMDAANRLDPYWDGLWGLGSAASWLSADLARRQVAAGLGRLPAPLGLDRAVATESVMSSRQWNSRLALMGSLFSWRTMTSEQAAAFTGDRRLASALSRTPASMFASGLMDLGVYSNGLRNTDLAGRGAVLRPSKGSVFDDNIKDRLSWPEWVSITGGQKWAAGTNYDRHNLLATELGLRLAEYTDIATVLGERFSSVDLLVGSGIGKPAIVGDQSAADLTAVRADGMRIVFEMTANTGHRFSAKVRKWARLIAENPLDCSGLTIVFVIIQHPERLRDKDGFLPRARTYQAISAACKEFPGTVRDRVAERMGVVTWREWFPGRGLVHDAFFSLRVDRPTGRGTRQWEPTDMLERPFTARDPEAMTAIHDNAALLGQTPHWQRAKRAPAPLWPLLLDRAGLDALPTPAPMRPEQIKGAGRRLGQGVGAAGDTKPPSRLLGLA